jgi:UTP:GlnB (protein PII) uridylyltransferase
MSLQALVLPDAAAPLGLWAISVQAQDSPGLLSKLLSALGGLGLDIRAADVRTGGDGRVENKFSVTCRAGLLAQEAVDALKQALR